MLAYTPFKNGHTCCGGCGFVVTTIKIQWTWNHWGWPHSTFGRRQLFHINFVYFHFVLRTSCFPGDASGPVVVLLYWAGMGEGHGQVPRLLTSDVQKWASGSGSEGWPPCSGEDWRVFRVLDCPVHSNYQWAALMKRLRGWGGSTLRRLSFYCSGGVGLWSFSFILPGLDHKQALRRADVYIWQKLERLPRVSTTSRQCSASECGVCRLDAACVIGERETTDWTWTPIFTWQRWAISWLGIISRSCGRKHWCKRAEFLRPRPKFPSPESFFSRFNIVVRWGVNY